MENLVKIINNREVVTDSLTVARYFKKNHQHVIRAIEQLLENERVLRASIFGQSHYESEMPTGGKKKYKLYIMNRDGFSLLAMGFTGEKVIEWKLDYISAFNANEKKLQESQKAIAQEKELRLLAAESDKIESDKRLNMFKIHKIMEEFGKPSEINGLPRTKPVAYLRGDERQEVAPFCDALGLYGKPIIIYIAKH